MELPCFGAPCFEACSTSLFWRSICQGQVLSVVGRPPFTGQSLGSDNVVFRIIVPPRYYAIGLKQKVGIL